MTKVLLVEDDSDLMRKYKIDLLNSNFEVACATNGSEMEKILRGEKFDIIVSDTDLGVHIKGGDEVCKDLLNKGYLKSTLIIGMSAVRDYDEYWKGIAHDFKYKRGITDLGASVKDIYSKFIKDDNPRRYKEFKKTGIKL